MQSPPHSPRTLLASTAVLVVAAAFALLAVAAGPAHAAGVAGVTGAVSDNYKARWNADPSVRERRIWLSMDSVAADGTAWAPTAPAAVTITPGAGIDLTGADGRAGRLELAVSAGAAEWTRVRADPSGRWGPLLSIPPGDSLRGQPLLVSAVVSSGGTTLAAGTLEYRYEPAFATASADHIEHNGPSGRWHIGGTAVATDWEPAVPPSTLSATAPAQPVAPVPPAPVPPAPAPPAPTSTGTGAGAGTAGAGTSSTAAPRIVRVLLPLRTTRRLITVRISGRGVAGRRITHVRVAVGARGWARWVPVAKSYSVTLPKGAASVALRFQVRDAAGRASAPVGRTVRCTC